MATYYMSPSATVGAGTFGNPWSIRRALNVTTSGIAAGDTLYYFGGTVKGHFVSTIAGAVGNPVTVRPYVDGSGNVAQLIIDTYIEHTLNGGLIADAAQTNIQITGVGQEQGTAGGCHLIVSLSKDDASSAESMQIASGVAGGYNVTRASDGTTLKAHSSGVVCYLSGNGISQTTSYVDWYFYDPDGNQPWIISKIINTNPIRSYATWVVGSPSFQHASNAFTSSNTLGVRCFGGIFLDNGTAYFMTNVESVSIVLPICQNLGHIDPDRGHGIGHYLQAVGAGITVDLSLSFNSFSGGAKGFGETATVSNINFTNSIHWNNGAQCCYVGNTGGVGLNARSCNFQVTSGSVRPQTCSITNCVAWNPIGHTDVAESDPNFLIEVVDGMTITGNRVFGNYLVHQNTNCTAITCTGNTFVGDTLQGNFQKLALAAAGDIAGVTWDNNIYYDSGTIEAALPSADRYTFSFTNPGFNPNELGSGNLRFSVPGGTYGDARDSRDWLGYTGKDVSTSYNPGGATKPAVNVLTLYSCAPYLTHRFHLAIENWEASSTITLPTTTFSAMSFAIGDMYRIHNALDFDNDITEGTYAGVGVSYGVRSSTGRTVLQANGLSETVPVNSWDATDGFGVLVIFRIEGTADIHPGDDVLMETTDILLQEDELSSLLLEEPLFFNPLSYPLTNRARLGPRIGQPISQTTIVTPAFTPDFIAGVRMPTPRIRLGPRIGQPLSQTTQTSASFSPEMVAGSQPATQSSQMSRLGANVAARVGQSISQTTPQVSAPVTATNHKDDILTIGTG